MSYFNTTPTQQTSWIWVISWICKAVFLRAAKLFCENVKFRRWRKSHLRMGEKILVFINFIVILNKPTHEPDWRWPTYWQVVFFFFFFISLFFDDLKKHRKYIFLKKAKLFHVGIKWLMMKTLNFQEQGALISKEVRFGHWKLGNKTKSFQLGIQYLRRVQWKVFKNICGTEKTTRNPKSFTWSQER